MITGPLPVTFVVTVYVVPRLETTAAEPAACKRAMTWPKVGWPPRLASSFT